MREIHLDGGLDDTQRATLLAIADRCRSIAPCTQIVIETDPV